MGRESAVQVVPWCLLTCLTLLYHVPIDTNIARRLCHFSRVIRPNAVMATACLSC
jgi:hypothetical protein